MTTRAKRSIIALMIAFLATGGTKLTAQITSSYPEDNLRQEEVAAHLRFLASDELMGRMTGTPWIDVAARYIAEQFRAVGLSTFPQAKDYFQPVPILRRNPPSSGRISLLGETTEQGKKMVLRSGGGMAWSGKFVFVSYGTVDSSKGIDDYHGIDVKGKVVAARFGAQDNRDLFTAFSTIGDKKRKSATERGAVALIELYRGSLEWRSLVSYLTRPSFQTAPAGNDIPHFLIEDTSATFAARLEKQTSGPAEIRTDGFREDRISARNVIGLVPGSDPRLRDQYVLLTAHYDHIGTGRPSGSSMDTIYNGARDNGMGTVALIEAARSFTAKPPKRSVIIAAVTSEEVGLFGSRELAANPPVPIEKIVFDLNSDGAGYDDTTIVTVVGLERTTAEPAIKEGAERYGLKAIPDPVPEQNLFNRSDNVPFAKRGVPAPTFSEGFRGFGEEILKYYHKASDQADENFNFSYFLRFCKAYVHSARLISDMKDTPFWKPGDEYEKAGRKLYQR